MKCKNCGREMSDDARFCEMCGKPVDTAPTPAADKTTGVDPRYDLSVFSDDSARVTAQRHTPDPIEDGAAKTVLLSQNDNDSALPQRPSRRPQAQRSPVDDDAAKTALLPEQNEPTEERNRFEENLALHRRYREERRRAAANKATPPAEADQGFAEEHRGYAPVEHPYTPDRRQGDPPRYNERARYGYDGSNHRDDPRPERGSHDRDPRGDRYADDKPREYKQKKALIISGIALVLVIAILAGVIFFVNRNTVSASELRDAKDKYLPPAKAVTIDTSQKDPSNNDIQFKYDDRARIVSCAYKANKKPYEQQYTYRDPDRMLDIETTYRSKLIHIESISYDKINTANDFVDVDGYLVRLDEKSLTSGLPATEAPTAAPTAAPTESPTTAPAKARTLTNAQSDEAMESFLQRFVSCYGFEVGTFEYDYSNRQGANPNILEKVCQQFTVADWELYSSGRRVEGWYQSNNNSTGLSPVDAPWIDESQANGAMGVVANRCDTADWICTNIFNVDPADLPTLYEQSYAEQKLWKAKASIGASYCAIIYGRGSIGFRVNIHKVKTDGQYYYVTYDRCDPYSGNVIETLFAIMEKKMIDGGAYWSMYSNTSNIPDTITPFTPDG